MENPKELRKVSIAKLSGVSLSQEIDNYIVVHVEEEYDWVFQTEHKIELLGLLRKNFRAIRNEGLKVSRAVRVVSSMPWPPHCHATATAIAISMWLTLRNGCPNAPRRAAS